MYWDLLNPADVTCSCGKQNCNFLNVIYHKVGKNHVTRPLLRIWQIIDKKYWPNKPQSGESLIPEGRKIPEASSLSYWLARCTKALNSVITAYQLNTGEKVFIDNSKIHQIGSKLFLKKDWGIIILLRDPRGIMSSYKNAGKRKGDFRTAASVLPFMFDFIKAVKLVSKSFNTHIIRYEDLCKNPESTIKLASQFIGVEYNQNMLDFKAQTMQQRGHVLKGNRLLYKSENFKLQEDQSWRINLTINELKKLKEQTKLISLYKSFGYQI